MEIVNLSHSKFISRSESLNESPDTSEINDSYIDDNDQGRKKTEQMDFLPYK